VCTLSIDLGGMCDVAVIFLGQVLGRTAGRLCSSGGSLSFGGLPSLLCFLLCLGFSLLSSLLGGSSTLGASGSSFGSWAGRGGLRVRWGICHCNGASGDVLGESECMSSR